MMVECLKVGQSENIATTMLEDQGEAVGEQRQMISNPLYVLKKCRRSQSISERRTNHVRNSYPGSLLLPFRLTLPFYQLHRSFRFTSSRPFGTSIVSFVSTLPVHLILPFSRFNASILFMYIFLPFQAVHVAAPFHSCQFLYTPFVDMFVLLQLVYFVCYFLSFGFIDPPVGYFLPFVSTPSFRLLSSCSCRYVRPYVSPQRLHLLLLPFCVPSYSPFVT